METLAAPISCALLGHTADITQICISPNRRVISAAGDHTCRVWELESGEETASFRGHTASVSALALTGQGTQVVSSSFDGTVRLWDVGSGAEAFSYADHAGWVRDVSVSGGKAVTASADCTAHLLDLGTGKGVRTFQGHTDWLRRAAWSPGDAGHFVTSARDNTVRVWDPLSPECVRVLTGHTDTVRSLAFSSLSGLLVTGSVDGTARVWDFRNCAEPTLVLNGHDGAALTRVGVASWRDMGVTAGADGKVKIWDLQTGQPVLTFDKHTDWVSDFAITQDRQIASCSGDGTVLVWSAATGQISATARPGRTVLTCAALSDDETTAVAFGLQSGDMGAMVMPSQEIDTPGHGAEEVGPEAAAAADAQAAPVEGDWFMKRGGWRKTGGLALTGRKKRFFTIGDEEICYFATVRDGVPYHQKGSITLMHSTEAEVNGRRLLVHNPDRTWDLEADSEVLALDWMARVHAAVTLFKERHPDPHIAGASAKPADGPPSGAEPAAAPEGPE